jgi:hypothetical protein
MTMELLTCEPVGDERNNSVVQVKSNIDNERGFDKI